MSVNCVNFRNSDTELHVFHNKVLCCECSGINVKSFSNSEFWGEGRCEPTQGRRPRVGPGGRRERGQCLLWTDELPRLSSTPALHPRGGQPHSGPARNNRFSYSFYGIVTSPLTHSAGVRWGRGQGFLPRTPPIPLKVTWNPREAGGEEASQDS